MTPDPEAIQALTCTIYRAAADQPLDVVMTALAQAAGGLIGTLGLPLQEVDTLLRAHGAATQEFARDAMLSEMTGARQ